MTRAYSFWRKRTLSGRLLIYFLIVLIVPLVLFAAYYALAGEAGQRRFLADQTLNIVSSDAARIADVMEEYRHKAYQLSTNPLVVRIMEEDRLDTNSPESKELYQLLFSVMRGDTYLASANLVSNTGRVRASTHVFPDVYDLRYHGNDWDMNSIISQNANISQTASIISLRGHRITESGRQVVSSILRRIYNAEGTNLGYLVLDIYADALNTKVNQDRILNDLLLVDSQSLYATSLMHSDQFGAFDRFSSLSELKGDYSKRTMQVGAAIVAITAVQGTPLYLVGSVTSSPFEESIDRLVFAFMITLLVGAFLAMGLSLLFSRAISRPISNLAFRMGEVEQGKLQIKEVRSSIHEFAQLEHSFNIMVRQIISLLELTREEQEKLSEAERKALESQMNPHFLFNTLNTIKAIAKLHNENDIYTITVKLGKLLRSTIDNHESQCTLEESMALIDSYLTIQRLRYGDKLKVETYLDPACAQVKTPKLIIQPLVENAIIHGLEPMAGEWRLSVRVEREQYRINITIRDNGVGIPEGTLPDNLDELANSTHVGVYNAYRRLFLTYGPQMTFSIDSKVGEGTTIGISFPDIYEERKDT